ncbi:MAG: hypothetical protein AW07_02938 [Candidatus Accumulibacter sp. SK-11]|nr:MAG: hypothetical protein AW07_02938 [Candidatus Accumulibacter sp. SK-11]
MYNPPSEQISNINYLQFYHTIMLIFESGLSMVAKPGSLSSLRYSPLPVH